MQKSFQPEYVLLGKRKYVHGTSQTHALLDALNAWGITNIKRIVGGFHKILRTGGSYHLFASKEAQADSHKAFTTTYMVEAETGKHYVGFESFGNDICASVPYDEDTIVENCAIDVAKRSASLVCKAEYHIFNTLVALNKRLHLSVLPHDEKTQWFFGAYDLSWPLLVNPEKDKLIMITITSNLNNTYTRSSVTINGNLAGHIAFAREKTK